MTWEVIVSDCVEAMKAMPDESIDAICTDPPFNWRFMNKKFDAIGSPREYQAWTERWATEAIRLLKPGGYAFVCGGDRTQHRQVAGLEDAGFKPKTIVVHIHSQGFPKGNDFAKDKDKSKAAKRRIPKDEFVGTPFENGWNTATKPAVEFWALLQKPFKGTYSDCVARYGTGGLNIAATRVGFTNGADERESKDKNRHADFGSGARFNNVYGEDKRGRAAGGNYNPPGGWPPNLLLSHIPPDANGDFGCVPRGTKRVKGTHPGTYRRDANDAAPDDGVILGKMKPRPVGFNASPYTDADGTEECESWECAEGCPVKALDEQAGERPGLWGGPKVKPSEFGGYGGNITGPADNPRFRDGTNVSRFFPSFPPDALPADDDGLVPFRYVAKASRRERNAGLDGMPERAAHSLDDATLSTASNRRCRLCGRVKFGQPHCECEAPEWEESAGSQHANDHPTVKSVALCRWLVRLVTPPNGTVLDCFMGSGSIGMAAVLEGFDFIGIDADAHYVDDIARHRIAHVERHGEDWLKAAGKAGHHAVSLNMSVDGSQSVKVCVTCDRRCSNGETMCPRCGGALAWRNQRAERKRRAEGATADLERAPEDVAYAESYADLPLFALASDATGNRQVSPAVAVTLNHEEGRQCG